MKYKNMPDLCRTCTGEAHLKTYYPREVKRRKRPGRNREELEAYYTCGRSHVWTCWWSTDRLQG